MRPTSAVLEYPVGGFRLAVRVGSIAERAGQVTVVASDDNHLGRGGGSSRAIWSALGDVLSTDPAVVRVSQGRRPDAGDIVVSGVAPGVSVLHETTLDVDRASRVTSRELVALYARSLDIVVEEGGAVVALPILDAGAAWVPQSETVAALVEAVHERSVLQMSCEDEKRTPEDATASDAAAFLARAARSAVGVPGSRPRGTRKTARVTVLLNTLLDASVGVGLAAFVLHGVIWWAQAVRVSGLARLRWRPFLRARRCADVRDGQP